MPASSRSLSAGATAEHDDPPMGSTNDDNPADQGPDQDSGTLAEVERALDDVQRAAQRVREAESALRRATWDLDDAARLHGFALFQEGQLVDRDLVSRLYWGAPSLHTKSIFKAFGLRSPNHVSVIAGSRDFTLTCRECGVDLTVRVKNRTELANLRSSNYCTQCEAEIKLRRERAYAQREREWQARHREEAEEETEALHRAMLNYVLAHPDLPEVDDGTRYYVDISTSERGGSTVVGLDQLHAVRRELVERLNRHENRS